MHPSRQCPLTGFGYLSHMCWEECTNLDKQVTLALTPSLRNCGAMAKNHEKTMLHTTGVMLSLSFDPMVDQHLLW